MAIVPSGVFSSCAAPAASVRREASPARSLVEVGAELVEPYVRLIVRDQGCGMSEETLSHAGEPFFTTKEPGQGVGLGVFLVRAVAERMGGRLLYTSVPGRGTTAALELPLAVEKPAEGKLA